MGIFRLLPQVSKHLPCESLSLNLCWLDTFLFGFPSFLTEKQHPNNHETGLPSAMVKGGQANESLHQGEYKSKPVIDNDDEAPECCPVVRRKKGKERHTAGSTRAEPSATTKTLNIPHPSTLFFLHLHRSPVPTVRPFVGFLANQCL